MTTEAAIALAIAAEIAGQTKPHRQPFNKLQGRATAAADLSAGVTALAKRYSDLGDSLSKTQTRLAQLEADVEFLKISHEEHPNMRKLHS